MMSNSNGASSAKGPQRILLVEDSRVQRLAIAAQLESHGYQVVEAADGADAVHQLAAMDEPPALILSDIGMPNVNGITLCRRIKKNPSTRDIPVVLLTVLDDERNQRAAIAAGADEFLTKPVVEQELILRLKSVLTSKNGSTHARQEWYRQIFDALSDGILVTDAQDRCVDANRALELVLGYSHDELVGLGSGQLVLEPKDWAETMKHEIDRSGAWQGQLDLKHKAGHIVVVEARVTSAFVDGDAASVWLVTPNTRQSNSGATDVSAEQLSRIPATDLIDSTKLYEMLGLRSGDSKHLSTVEHDRLANLKIAVRDAAAVGRVRRLVKRDPDTREIIGYVYLRAEIQNIIRNRG